MHIFCDSLIDFWCAGCYILVYHIVKGGGPFPGPTAAMSKWSVCTMILGGGHVDRTVITRDQPYGDKIHVPYVSLAATDGEHRVVIDTGAYEVDTKKKPWAHRYPEEELDAVLQSCMGWRPEDVDVIINTHLHYDHCGQNCRMPNAKIYVQRAEWEAAGHLTPYEAGYYHPEDYGKDRISFFRWRFVDGMEEILPGLLLLPTPGHTRGSQSVLLDTDEGTLCFPGDTFTTRLNLERNIQPAIVVNDKQLFESMDLIRRVSQRIVFSHDAEIVTGMRGGFCRVPER